MEFVLSVLVGVLAYLTFVDSDRKVGGLRRVWWLLVGVMGFQMLSNFFVLYFLNNYEEDAVKAQVFFGGISWGLMAFAVFVLVDTALPLSAQSDEQPTPPASPPADASNI